LGRLSPSSPLWPEGFGRIVKLFEKKPIKKNGNGGGSSAPEGSPMDVDLLQQIVKLMAANDLNTVDVRDGDRRIILKRGAATPVMMSMPTMSAPMSNPAGASTTPPPPVDEEAGLKPIKSPMVGTFYAAPSPDAKPFVNVGSKVDEESDVCVIEAMKVFNNIKAEVRGTIAKILIQSGQAVEFGQTLFLVKPS
jgi:acetyl-CoA carboxylase biotin carboxyl carrier protein